MRLSLLTTLALLFFTFPSVASEQSRIEELHNQAYQLLDVDLNLAMILADSSLLLSQEAGLAWEEANSYYIKGYIYKYQNSLSKAVVMYLKSARILDLLYQDSEKAAKTYTSILLNAGSIFRKYYKYEEAIELLDKGLAVATAWGLEKQQLKLLYNKASALYFQGSLPQSLDILKETTSLANKLSNTPFLLKSFNLLGLVHKESAYFNEAREYFNYVIQHPRVSHKDKALALHNTGITYREEKNVDSTKYFYDQALAIERTLNEPSVWYITLHGLAEWHLDYGEIEIAEKYAGEAESLYSELIREPNNYDIYYLLDTINHVKESYHQSQIYASKYYQESKAFNREREELIKQLREFQMDLILSGFEAEQLVNEEHRRAARYQWLALVAALLAIAIYFGWKAWFHNHRKQLGKRISAVVEEWEMRI